VRSFWKVVPWRCRAYLDWIKSLPCVICGEPADDPHHEQLPGHGGMGTTPGDDRAVPMCRGHHDERQSYPDGGEAYWHKHGRDIEALIQRLNGVWEMMKGTKIAA
jgi:hypothetical protein